jgi:hypothetical protein
LVSSEKQKEYSKKCKSNWDSIKAYKHEKYKKILKTTEDGKII